MVPATSSRHSWSLTETKTLCHLGVEEALIIDDINCQLFTKVPDHLMNVKKKKIDYVNRRYFFSSKRLPLVSTAVEVKK